MEMDETEIRANLDKCLLTDSEMQLGSTAWAGFADPFPVWGEAAVEDEVTVLDAVS